jgi:DNA-binding NarL/FixJ family response regulator
LENELMPDIRGLLVDNHEGNAESIEHTMDLEFDRFGWRVRWERCQDALQARSLVRRAYENFDFAIVDLYLGAEREGGLAVVEELRARDGRTFILVVTSRPERHEGFVTQAVNAGATHALIRGQLSREKDPWSFQELAERIRTHLVKHGLAAPGIMTYDENDPGIISILESLGGSHPSEGSIERGLQVVRSLAMGCLKPPVVGTATFKLSYLVPGRSGAYVCRVDLRVPGQPTEYFVLKFGLDQDALRLEHRSNFQARRLLDRVLVPTMGDIEFDSSGYCAIAFRVAEGAVTLGRWLSTADEQQAREVAAELFGEYLRNLFREELWHETPAAEWMASSALVRLRTRAVLDNLTEALAHPHGGGRDDVDLIRRTLLDFTSTGTLRVTQPKRLTDPVRFVCGFGDLHSSNVLVQEGIHARPLLIDASRFGNHHWAADSARMIVDLFLRIRNTGLDALLWDDFTTSVQQTRGLCPLCQVDRPAEPTGPVEIFIHATVERLPELLQFEYLRLVPDVWHWQWHVALAKEFIRQASHSDLTPPRSAVALVAGADQLLSATRIVDALEYG